jgi:lysyl-tRNA synthetase class 2
LSQGKLNGRLRRLVATTMSDSGSWRPTAKWPAVASRALLLRELRSFFDRRQFVEIETPILSRDTVVDRHLDPFSVTLFSDATCPDNGPNFWLQTSPEFGMKRALIEYRRPIYQITRAFRAAETGSLHNPEFTILEWYDTPAGYSDGMNLLAALADEVLRRGLATRMTYADAFETHLGVDPHLATATELREKSVAAGLDHPEFGDDRDGWLDWLLSELIQPKLGRAEPIILHDYPASQAALARIQGTPPVAERFELFVDGIELANGYHELDDPEKMAERAAGENRKRLTDGKPQLPERSRLLEAAGGHFPPSAGAALGVDRLLMVRLGLHSIDEVLTFPVQRA